MAPVLAHFNLFLLSTFFTRTRLASPGKMSINIEIKQILVGNVSIEDGNTQFVHAACSVTLVEERISNESKERVAQFRMLVDCASSYEREKLVQALHANGIAPADITHLVITHWHLDHCANIGLFPTAHLITPERILTEGSERINADLPEFISVGLYGGHSTPGDVIVKVKQRKKHNEKFLSWTTAIVGDLFEFENDWLFDQPWRQCSVSPDRQLISRFLCWKGTNEIIPGHGPSFRLTSTFPEKSAFGSCDFKTSKPYKNDQIAHGNATISELLSFTVINDLQQQQKLVVYIIKGGGERVLVNTGGPGQSQQLIEALLTHGVSLDDVNHVVVTNLGVHFCYNLHLFKNAKAFMSTDVALPNCTYGSLGKLFVISSDISIWCDMDPIRNMGSLSVLIKTTHEKRERFTLIGSKLDAFIPVFLDLKDEDIQMLRVVQSA